MRKDAFQSKLEKINTNYEQVINRSASHFFCPILFTDEDVELCKAHIVNQAFPESTPNWTIQRKDIDNFNGSFFEADFIAVQYNEHTHEDIFTNKKLSKLFKPQILVDNQPVDYFILNKKIPSNFTPLQFENGDNSLQLGLKISPKELEEAQEKNWEMSVSKDVRLQALVSLIKAAHLTLFEMLGYKYAFSSGGYFVGKSVLGSFFLQNYGKSKSEVLENSYSFFQEFVNMARPLISSEISFQGTATDNQLLLCQKQGDIAWGMIVFVKTAQIMNAVLLPLFDQPDSVVRFFDFLNDKENETIDVALMHFTDNHFEISRATKIIWPKNDVSF
jgi:hypothetical protein